MPRREEQQYIWFPFVIKSDEAKINVSCLLRTVTQKKKNKKKNGFFDPKKKKKKNGFLLSQVRSSKKRILRNTGIKKHKG